MFRRCHFGVLQACLLVHATCTAFSVSTDRARKCLLRILLSGNGCGPSNPLSFPRPPRRRLYLYSSLSASPFSHLGSLAPPRKPLKLNDKRIQRTLPHSSTCAYIRLQFLDAKEVKYLRRDQHLSRLRQLHATGTAVAEALSQQGAGVVRYVRSS